MLTRSRGRAACLLLSLAFVVPAFAQQVGAGAGTPVLADFHRQAPAPSWGTSADSVAVTLASELVPPSNTMIWSIAVIGQSVGLAQLSGPTINWWGRATVPSGAVVSKVQIEACDSSSSGELLFGLARGTAPATAVGNITDVGTTGLVATPGCGFFEIGVLSPAVTLNGSQNLWFFLDWNGGFDGSVRIYAVRVFYKLTVSPAPSTATFADVSNAHPFFQYIEALAAAGITAGCTAPPNPNYCPNDPITRGQMAVFVSRALGLHWSP